MTDRRRVDRHPGEGVIMSEHTFELIEIGTKIFIPGTKREELPVTCPDCHGTKKWFVHIAGVEGSKVIECPRCGGGEHEWLIPKRYKTVIEIKEFEVTGFEIDRKPKWQSDELETIITYHTNPHRHGVRHGTCYLTQEEAQAAGDIMLEEADKKIGEEYAKERERCDRRAGHDIVKALRDHAFRHSEALQEKIDKLKSEMLEAITYPSLHGPKLTQPRSKYGSPELTSSALAEWFSNLLDEANIEGWSEEEIHEATCRC
jgi:hypothetical protein